jgi:hypothetical protein
VVTMRIEGWTEAQIAQYVGVSQQTVSRWLSDALAANEDQVREQVPHLRALMGARMDRLGKHLMEVMESGDGEREVQAAGVLVRLLTLSMKVYGLAIEPAAAAAARMGPIVVEAPDSLARGILGQTRTTAELGRDAEGGVPDPDPDARATRAETPATPTDGDGATA